MTVQTQTDRQIQTDRHRQTDRQFILQTESGESVCLERELSLRCKRTYPE